MQQLAHGAGGAGFGLWGRAALRTGLARRRPEDRPMMSGVLSPHPPRPVPARRYAVVARAGGWSIVLNGACTRPFRSRRAAERIARALQKQADALNGLRRGGAH
jgi:hypothetical protein